MVKLRNKALYLSTLAVSSLSIPSALAVDYKVSGFIRQEMAYKLTSDENPANRSGSRFNGSVYRSQGNILKGINDLTPLNPIPPGTPINSMKDKYKENDWNVFATRAEIDIKAKFNNNLTGFMKIRGYYQPDVFQNVPDSKYIDGVGGKVNHFSVPNHGNEATYLSKSDNNYMIDIPSMYLDWASGPYWLRIGQQQIAWGESLFFRVADQVSGLDFRRHVIFDFGAEEYADERLSAPAIRGSMVFGDGWEIEAWAQMFQPTILPTNYSAYNIISNAYNPDYKTGFDKVDNNINAGIRLTGEIGNLGMQFFAISQHNHDPIFNLRAGGQKLMPDKFCASRLPDLVKILCGFEDQPFVFERGGSGASHPDEWFYMANTGYSDGLDALNGLVADWPWIAKVTEVLGLPTNENDDFLTTIKGGGPNTMYGLVPGGVNGYDFIELFFAVPVYDLVGPRDSNGDLVRLNSLSGNMVANYASQNVFGFGFNYIFYAEPDSFLDQLVVRFEASYTPDKKFSQNLRSTFIEKDEWLTSLVVEKYQRFSDAFPATFFIFQWMHRTQSNMLGMHLSGAGGTYDRRPSGGESSRGFDAFVIALVQPFPGLKWRVDLATIYDPEGAFLFSPAVRYKPNADWTVEVFANIIDSSTSATLQPFDWSDDITMRLTYQF